ncbi:MAG: hypothetical protein EU540_09100 [Promethearchaeota archaeon]|nr:MAG: hypothetical protein EU540_09100 [Candidatus Lokiarchaeota archaeon]
MLYCYGLSFRTPIFFKKKNFGESLTSVVVPSYSYTYIKLEFLKQLIMDDDVLKRVRLINDIKELVDYIRPYYPKIKVEVYSIEEIEKALYHTFIKLIGKILYYSPSNMRLFLRDYLLQFQIMNIKQIILGTIVGMTRKEKSKLINILVEKLLGNEEFINRLIDANDLDEIQLLMKNTRYYKAVREGILYFRNYNEVFVLESFLDQLYYQNLIKEEKSFNRTEKKILNLYIDCITEVYNLNIIYRSLLNKIDKKLVSQFLVENYLFFNKNEISNLVQINDINDFITKIVERYKEIDILKKFISEIGVNKEHLYWWIEGLYINYIFNKLIPKIDNIDYSTILGIIKMIIGKQKEIQFDILPNVVKVIHRKFDLLE